MIAYFDTSALIKLIVDEPGEREARLLWQQAGEVVVSRLVWPEVIAALAAARRGQRLTEEAHATAVTVATVCLENCIVVSVADELVDQAASLAQAYGLRAADAVHLATALAAIEPHSVFVSWDKRLRQAATTAGLVVAPAEV